MQALYRSTCYLSSAIECDDPKLFINWREETTEKLTSKFGINIFDPTKDVKQSMVEELKLAIDSRNFDKVEEISKKFTKKDLAEIDRCSFLIACVIKGVPSTGVPCEVVHAISLKKPVMIVAPYGKHTCPIWYFGNMKHQYIFGSWDELYLYLAEVDEGKHTNNHRWWYTYRMI